MGRVLAQPPLAPPDAYFHFAAKLALETDPSDVWADLQSGQPGFVVVDSRREDAFVGAHVPGAVHLPYAAMDEATCRHFLGPPGDRLCVVYCWGNSCNAADKGGLALAGLGYPVKVMIGGIDAWRDQGYPIEGAEA